MTAPAFVFPARTGAAQHDGLALLRHVIAYGVTPADLDACQLALHVAPLAFLGAPEGHTVAAVNRAVDQLAAAVRRLTALAADEAREQAARLAKLARLFEDEPSTGDGGSRVPVTPPPPPAPPAPDAIHPLEQAAQQLAEKAGIDLAEARKLIIDRVRAQRAAQPQEAA